MLQIVIYLQFVNSIPRDLDESAMLEGRPCSKSTVPSSSRACAGYGHLGHSEEHLDLQRFYTPYLYMPSQDLKVVSTAIYSFIGPNAARLNVISAGILIIFIPTVVLFLFMRRYIFAGLRTEQSNNEH